MTVAAPRLKRPDGAGILPGSEADVPPGYDPGRFPKPAVTVDIIALAPTGGDFEVLLIRRGGAPYKGFWALPGGFLEMDEDLSECALRELEEETGLRIDPRDPEIRFEQVGTWGRPGRDPRDRIITVTYLIVLSPSASRSVASGDDAAAAAWFPLSEAERSDGLAFDHGEMLEKARRMLARR